jgi:hypothetical protein
MPGGEQLGEPSATQRKYTRVAAISDPFDPSRRLLATVNIRTDLLELEYAHGRISEAALRAGREIQKKLEHLGRVGAGNQWLQSDRVDQYQRHEEVIVDSLAAARAAEAHFARIGRCLGKDSLDVKILRNILGDNMSYGAVASLHGKRGDRGIRYVAERFRDSLETLANAQAAKGWDLE